MVQPKTAGTSLQPKKPALLQKDVIPDREFRELQAQAESEYEISESSLQPQRAVWKEDDNLYRFQKQQGYDPHRRVVLLPKDIFQKVQTMKANITPDSPIVRFTGRVKGDASAAATISALQTSDYRDMDLDDHAQDSTLHKLLFGVSFTRLDSWDRKRKHPIAELIHPLVTYLSLSAETVHGTIERGGSGFFGWDSSSTIGSVKEWIRKKESMDTSPWRKEVLNRVKQTFQEAQPPGGYVQRGGVGTNEEYQRAKNATDSPTVDASLTGDNRRVFLRNWYTRYGTKIYFMVMTDSFDLLAVQEFESDEIPVFSEVFIKSGGIVGISVPSLVRDVQIAKQDLINLMHDRMAYSVSPPHFFQRSAFQDRSVVENMSPSSFVPVEIPEGVKQMEIAGEDPTPFMEYLNDEANKSLALGGSRVGEDSGAISSATQQALERSATDLRLEAFAATSVLARKGFWRRWLSLYQDNLTGNKAIPSPKGNPQDTVYITPELIRTSVEPYISVTTESALRRERRTALQDLTNALSVTARIAPQHLDPLYTSRQILRASGMDEDEVMSLYPLSGGEYTALQENQDFEKNKVGIVLEEDNDADHLRIHRKAKPSPYRDMHIELHVQSLQRKGQSIPVDERVDERAEETPVQPGEALGVPQNVIPGGRQSETSLRSPLDRTPSRPGPDQREGGVTTGRLPLAEAQQIV